MSIIIANWKMNLGLNESVSLASSLKDIDYDDKEVVICPSFVNLIAVGEVLKPTRIKLGAQDCFWEPRGSYTGEVSLEQLKQVGCEFVIIGHSERRQNLGETDAMVNQKVKAALVAGFTPIICVGETHAQREAGETDDILIKQTTAALEGVELDSKKRIIIAYEPVWVIGTGNAIKPSEASAAISVITKALENLFSAEQVKNNFSLIYGGSVSSSNISSFSREKNISGVLVGGASLDAEEFINLVKNF